MGGIDKMLEEQKKMEELKINGRIEKLGEQRKTGEYQNNWRNCKTIGEIDFFSGIENKFGGIENKFGGIEQKWRNRSKNQEEQKRNFRNRQKCLGKSMRDNRRQYFSALEHFLLNDMNVSKFRFEKICSQIFIFVNLPQFAKK